MLKTQGFIARTTKHDTLKIEVEKLFRLWGYQIIQTGRENVAGDIELGNDPASKFMRMLPDIAVVSNSKSFYLDFKASKFIEKEPYEAYKHLAIINVPVLLVARPKEGWEIRFCLFDELVLLPPSHQIWPIVGGWIAPREHPDYIEYKTIEYPLTPGRVYKGSGTPFREFDYRNMETLTQMTFTFAVGI